MTPALSDHFNGKTFFQRGSHPERGLRHVLKWKLTSKPARWPQSAPLLPQPTPPTPSGRDLVATWLGHASFLVQTTAGNLLLDPVFSERVSPFRWIGPKRAHPVPISLEALPRIDVVCLSHDHYDHWDAATVRWLAAASPDTVFVTPLRHEDLLREAGVKRSVQLDWWQSWRSPAGIEITLTPTKHWSNRFGTPRNHRLWGGFWIKLRNADCGVRNENTAAHVLLGSEVSRSEIRTPQSELRTSARRLWFVGDSGYDEPLFREIGQRLGAPDLALVPIGAYEPRWFMAPMHMNPEEAVRLHRDTGAGVSVAMHWGTFQLTDEAREAPVRGLEEARVRQGVAPEEFRVVAPGETVVV